PKIKPFPSRKRVLIKENCLLRWADEFGRRYQTFGERKTHNFILHSSPTNQTLSEGELGALK
ncbi:hypothetical protein LINPERPRIM_LOCUS38385, partial [Linum perenne]